MKLNSFALSLTPLLAASTFPPIPVRKRMWSVRITIRSAMTPL